MRRVWGVVHLTRIYTRTGDGGQTRLVDMSLDRQDRSAGRGVRGRRRGQLADRRALATGELPADV